MSIAAKVTFLRKVRATNLMIDRPPVLNSLTESVSPLRNAVKDRSIVSTTEPLTACKMRGSVYESEFYDVNLSANEEKSG
jgi:hypothetical protein